MAVPIHTVQAGSPARLAGLKPGMALVSLDGHEINDGLDFEFYAAAARPGAVVQDGPRQFCAVLEKEEYAPTGIGFASYLIDGQHHCKNKCVFCFIDQLPRGMRESLYFKDDDERLGFLFGNYVTLTNLGEDEIERIIRMRISPVNISVHTANPALRVQMMKNPRAGEVLSYIPRLAKAGIAMNLQLVLCPGLNDGEELRRSIEWLAGFAPAVQSIAAVPVGLTAHRGGLAALRAYTPEEATAQLDILLEYGDAFAKEGRRLAYPSDEWFLLAGRPVPPDDFYDDYPQLENGVGMWRLFYDEFIEALEKARPRRVKRRVDLATGTLAVPLFEALAGLLQKKFPRVSLRVHAVENRFFGGGVNVAGLLTGRDIIEQCKGRLAGDTLLLPPSALRAEGDVMLDGTAPARLEEALGVRVLFPAQSGGALLDAVLGRR